MLKNFTSLVLHFLQQSFRKRVVWVPLVLLAGIVLLSFVLRNVLLNHFIDKYSARFNQAFHAELHIGQAYIRGFSSLQVNHISLRPVDGDTLLRIDSIFATISFRKLLTGRIVLDNFELTNTWLTFVRKEKLTNYMFLLDRNIRIKEAPDSLSKVNYASRMSSILDAVFDKIPDDLLIRNFNITSNYNNHLLSCHLDTLAIRDHQFSAPIHIREDNRPSGWQLEGHLNKHDHIAHFALFASEGKKTTLPFLHFRWGADISFDTLRFSIEQRSSGNKLVTLNGNAAIHGLEIRHARVAADTVVMGTASLDYTFHAGSDYFELDSLTEVHFNQLSVHPYLKVRPRPDKRIELLIRKENFPACDLFSSLPRGLFDNLEGLKVKGDLRFLLDFRVDLARPDSLTFVCELQRKNFFIQSFGNTDFTSINGPFEYTAYEKGEPVRTFWVGPENPDFRTLGQISPYLQNAVINSEDGAFFGHRGFLPEAFRESIITNIKERRFARGGSTITMQLVKNVFLNRNKTISRKLEEVLIVWLIENCGLCSKERMFEVYLNIIEWGPLVYGAQEASRFYFNKDVSRLTYAEAIYLASIIPRPKFFKYSFDEKGDLKEYIVNYYQRMADKMLKKGMITQEDYDRLIPRVELKGPARQMLLKPDSIPEVDSLFFFRSLQEP